MENIIAKRVSFETAKLLRRKGFHWRNIVIDLEGNVIYKKVNFYPVETYNFCFNDEGKEITPKIYNPKNNHYPRPTLTLVSEWLRKVHETHVVAFFDMNLLVTHRFIYRFIFASLKGTIGTALIVNHDEYNDYNECLEAGIVKVLNLLPDIN